MPTAAEILVKAEVTMRHRWAALESLSLDGTDEEFHTAFVKWRSARVTYKLLGGILEFD